MWKRGGKEADNSFNQEDKFLLCQNKNTIFTFSCFNDILTRIKIKTCSYEFYLPTQEEKKKKNSRVFSPSADQIRTPGD